MIYGVSFSEDLADSLVRDLLEKYKNNPLQLARVHIVLPTKRACLCVKNTFMHLMKDKGLLLPQLLSLYELDFFDETIPPALSKLERTLLLARLCMAKPNILSYDQALKMAISLGELLDYTYQYDLDFSKIGQLVQEKQFATHWEQTVQFLDILHTYWPQILNEQGKIDPTDRIIRTIRSFISKIRNGFQYPIVLAGFTDIFPAISELIEVVSKNDNNLILKENYYCDDSQIPFYTDLHRPQERIVIEALTKDSWERSDLPDNTFQNVMLLQTETMSEEALAIALILREVLETPNQTASLVTTDRVLARQVISQMKRWGVQLDDSAGTPLNHTESGVFLELIAEVGLHPTATNYLALLKHPLSADKNMPGKLHQLVQSQEKVLREKQSNWTMNLNVNFDPWIHLFQNNILTPFAEILKKHMEIAENLATSADKSAVERLWQTEDGQVLFQLISDLLVQGEQIGEIEPATYPAILKLLMQQISIRPKYGMHPRLDILGPIEARFHHTDVCVIGGLNEGVFPPLPETGPWLNRPMRAALGLPSPEEKIKELALDFAHNFCASKVYLTRAQKMDGAQTVPSRFIERLSAVAKINNLVFPEYQSRLPKLLDEPDDYDSSKRPTPCPPRDARPKHLPVTQIEMWRRNPYAIYARYILKLRPLPMLENVNKNAQFGTLIHEVIKEFLSEKSTSQDKSHLLHIAEKIFDESCLNSVDKILLKIKFEAMADFIIEQQQKDFSSVKESLFEEKMVYTFDVDGEPFTLEGTADKIDILKDNSVRVIDYKTYIPPKQKEVKAGYAPQLTLEALLISETISLKVSTLSYWHLSDKKDQSMDYNIVESVSEANDLIQKTKEGVFQMIRTYRNEAVSYEVCPIPSQAPQYNDYAHLARMQEWAFETGDDA